MSYYCVRDRKEMVGQKGLAIKKYNKKNTRNSKETQKFKT